MIVLAYAFAATFVLGFAMRWVGVRVGAVDRPGDALKPHARPTPYLGGVAVALGTLLGVAAVPEWVRIDRPEVIGVVLAGALMLGLADDRFHLPEFVRLGLQLALGVILALGGVRFGAAGAAGFVVAPMVFAAALNAVNMVDGMDGLAAGAGAISALGLAMVASAQGRVAVLALALTGAALGFLMHNAPRAALFLGDNGAYFLGAALAVLALAAGLSIPGAAGAITCFGIFGLDLVLSLLRRFRRRAPLTEGDRGHLYDQLLANGLSPRATLAVCFVLQGLFVAAGVLAAGLASGPAVIAATGAWIAGFAGLFAGGFVTYEPSSEET